MNVSKGALKVMAAGVWYIGGIVLLLKTVSLLREAEALQPDRIWPVVAIASGLVIGGLKGLLLFRKTCHKNMTRIEGLAQPRIWLFFRPMFFFFLAVMIAGGATLSRMAHGQYGFLIGVAIVDLSIATALLSSSYVFWKRWRSATG